MQVAECDVWLKFWGKWISSESCKGTLKEFFRWFLGSYRNFSGCWALPFPRNSCVPIGREEFLGIPLPLPKEIPSKLPVPATHTWHEAFGSVTLQWEPMLHFPPMTFCVSSIPFVWTVTMISFCTATEIQKMTEMLIKRKESIFCRINLKCAYHITNNSSTRAQLSVIFVRLN